MRLTDIGRDVGLVDDSRYEQFTKKRSALERLLQFLNTHHAAPSAAVNAKLDAMGVAPLRTGVSYTELLRRNGMTYGRLAELVELPEAGKVVAEQAEIHAKYEGYIVKQQQAVEKALKLENKKIPADFDYKKLKELSGEATEKLLQIKPDSVGQAARISGVSPADIGVLLIALAARSRQEGNS